MDHALHGELSATLKSAIHITAAIVIMWCFYRIANGQMSLL